MEIRVERAHPEHAEGIQEVFYRAWLATYPNAETGISIDDIEDRFKDRNTKEKLEKRRADIAATDDSRALFVALDGEKVIGVCRAGTYDNENRLHVLYVLPEHQGKGIGTRLWSAAMHIFDPNKDTLVGVATYNEKAQRFYAKLGFVDTGRRYTEERHRMKSGATIPEMDMIIRGGTLHLGERPE